MMYMCIKIKKNLKGYRYKYAVDYCYQDNSITHLFEFDEKEVFHTGNTGTSSFYRSDIKDLLNEFKVYNKVENKLNIEKKTLERMIIEAIEDFYEYEFKPQFIKKQYRAYLREEKKNEIIKNMIYFEEEYEENFNDEEHFKMWYINIINYNYNTKFTTYNEARRHHKCEGWKRLKDDEYANPYHLTSEESELFKEVLKAGFTKLAKKYHPDVNGDNEKMQLLNILKEKLQSN